MTNANFVEFSRPFVEAAKNVFETMVYTKLDPQKPYIKESQCRTGDISAVLGVFGDITREGVKKNYKGMLVLSFPLATYLKVASAMLMQDYREYTKDIADVGGEISNMIMGNAKKELAAIGYTSNMAIPSMIEGKDHNVTYPANTTVIVMPMISAHGEFFMELCYKEE